MTFKLHSVLLGNSYNYKLLISDTFKAINPFIETMPDKLQVSIGEDFDEMIDQIPGIEFIENDEVIMTLKLLVAVLTK